MNITSANGHWSLPGLSIYCATKHAVEGFSNSLRAEMIPWNIKVVLINPGNIAYHHDSIHHYSINH